MPRFPKKKNLLISLRFKNLHYEQNFIDLNRTNTLSIKLSCNHVCFRNSIKNDIILIAYVIKSIYFNHFFT